MTAEHILTETRVRDIANSISKDEPLAEYEAFILRLAAQLLENL